jgi:hypothetical protein
MSTATMAVETDGVVARLKQLAVATAAGAAAGFAIGGVGGRLAMLLLRLTSDPTLRGLKTDDGFTIGIVSGDTTFLLAATTILGAVGGAAYFLVRPVLTERSAPWAWGALGATVGGATILRPNGIDFTLLQPLALAVAMFIAIPAAGAAATSVLTERWLRRGPRSTAWLLGLGPFVLVALGGPVTMVGVAAVLGLAIALPADWVVSRDRVPRPLALGGRAALAVAGALGVSALVNDVLEIL